MGVAETSGPNNPRTSPIRDPLRDPEKENPQTPNPKPPIRRLSKCGPRFEAASARHDDVLDALALPLGSLWRPGAWGLGFSRLGMGAGGKLRV